MNGIDINHIEENTPIKPINVFKFVKAMHEKHPNTPKWEIGECIDNKNIFWFGLKNIMLNYSWGLANQIVNSIKHHFMRHKL